VYREALSAAAPATRTAADGRTATGNDAAAAAARRSSEERAGRPARGRPTTEAPTAAVVASGAAAWAAAAAAAPLAVPARPPLTAVPASVFNMMRPEPPGARPADLCRGGEDIHPRDAFSIGSRRQPVQVQTPPMGLFGHITHAARG
jgi:hypothetical protein